MQLESNGYSVFHCNIRSLEKNLNLLNDILITFKEAPSIIAISETKLKNNSATNISIPGYQFLSKHSLTSAGGVGIYAKEDIQFSRRQDINLDLEGVETCVIEISRSKQRNLTFGCIYRHPSSNLEKFQQLLSQKLNFVNQSGLEACIAGDVNINFFNTNLTKQLQNILTCFSR